MLVTLYCQIKFLSSLQAGNKEDIFLQEYSEQISEQISERISERISFQII